MGTVKSLFLVSIVVLIVLLSLLMFDISPLDNELSGEPLIFYCAAGIKAPVSRISEQYEQENGQPIQLMYGGSGTLLSSLSVADKGDLYLAADQTYIDLAREKDLIAEVMPVAFITPVILVSRGNPKNIHSIQDLLRDDVNIALANPDAASVGRTVKDLLEESGMWAKLEKKAQVFKPTVNDIANDVKIGSVDAGIVWDSLLFQYPDLESVSVPELEMGKQQISIAVLKSSRQPTEAIRFARYLTARDKGLLLFREEGYEAVEGDKWVHKPEIVLFSGTVNRPAIDDTLMEFKEREDVDLIVKYNGCGFLVADMKAGQRPDAYFACDVSFMHQVGDLFEDETHIAETDVVILTQKEIHIIFRHWRT